MRYRVTYYYLATGMEGIPDIRDMGVVEADSPDQACDMVAAKEPTDELRRWTRGCLSAKLDPSWIGRMVLACGGWWRKK